MKTQTAMRAQTVIQTGMNLKVEAEGRADTGQIEPDFNPEF